jgi:hypothetical protein
MVPRNLSFKLTASRTTTFNKKRICSINDKNEVDYDLMLSPVACPNLPDPLLKRKRKQRIHDLEDLFYDWRSRS